MTNVKNEVPELNTGDVVLLLRDGKIDIIVQGFNNDDPNAQVTDEMQAALYMAAVVNDTDRAAVARSLLDMDLSEALEEEEAADKPGMAAEGAGV